MDFEQLFGVIRLSSAQRELVYEAARKLALESDDEVLLAHVELAVAHEGEVRELESARKASSTKVTYAPGTKVVDGLVDKNISSLRDVIMGHAEGADEETAAKADELLLGIFPNGVDAVTRLNYVDEAAACQDILTKLETAFAEHVSYFGLERKVAALGELVAEYNEMVRLGPDLTTGSEVQSAQDRGHLYMLEVIARVMGMNFDSENPEHVAARGRVLQVLVAQIEQTRARKQARRARRRRGEGEGSRDDSQADTGAG